MLCGVLPVTHERCSHRCRGPRLMPAGPDEHQSWDANERMRHTSQIHAPLLCVHVADARPAVVCTRRTDTPADRSVDEEHLCLSEVGQAPRCISMPCAAAGGIVSGRLVGVWTCSRVQLPTDHRVWRGWWRESGRPWWAEICLRRSQRHEIPPAWPPLVPRSARSALFVVGASSCPVSEIGSWCEAGRLHAVSFTRLPMGAV